MNEVKTLIYVVMIFLCYFLEIQNNVITFNFDFSWLDIIYFQVQFIPLVKGKTNSTIEHPKC